jgi:hypothetical protein
MKPKNSLKVVKLYRYANYLKYPPLMLLGIFSILFSLFNFEFIESYLMMFIEKDIRDLEYYNKSLVSNIMDILNKIKSIASDFNLRTEQVTVLLEDKDFEQKLFSLKNSLINIEKSEAKLSPVDFYFTYFGHNNVEAAINFGTLLEAKGPLLYNSNVEKALSPFKEVKDMFTSSTTTKFVEQSANIDPINFSLDDLYTVLINSIS